MKRAAITGITGQDGTYLARLLLAQGYEIHGLLRHPFDREEARLRRRFTSEQVLSIKWHCGALEDPFSIVRLLKAARPDEVYHLAGLSDSRLSFQVPEEAMTSIAIGTLRLLEAARELCPEARIFLASSCEVFGVPAQTPQDENTLMRPFTPYGIAKLAADQFARMHREKYGQFVSVGILYNHESPLRPPNYLSSRVARAVAAIKRGKLQKLELAELSTERDWSDSRDFARGFPLTLRRESGGDYVFASGVRRRVSDLVDCAFKVAGLDSREYVVVASRGDGSRQVTSGLCGNAGKAERELGWKREWSFEQTIEDMVRAELDDRPEVERADPSPLR